MKPKTKAQTIPTRFSCKAPSADTVQVAGTFNDWNESDSPMKKQDNGIWITDLHLEPGHYEFKFIVDGEWCCDSDVNETGSECPSCVCNAFGTMNMAIDVK